MPTTIPQRRSPEALSDEALLTDVGRGDREALTRLYDRHYRTVFAQALRITGDRDLAEDVTQEVFLRVWRRAETYDPARGRAIAWLMTVTHNQALNHLRHPHCQQRLPTDGDGATTLLELADPAADTEREAWHAEEQRLLVTALGTLPLPQREVIVAAFYGGLSHAQIAERQGLPFGTVKSRIRLGLRRLGAQLEWQGPELGLALHARAAEPAA
ncbi:MAG: sigma-70 family RNA polymerase sigma factor [Chloroflexi bacterium]|nr:sigma-70 family RNA polymerase sigma factor [Chloroflexota bacterium]